MEGRVTGGAPFLTKIGNFDVELAVQGSVMLTRQRDQPGIVGGVGMLLSRDNVNIRRVAWGWAGWGGWRWGSGEWGRF